MYYLDNYKRSELDDFLVNLSPNFYSLNTKRLEELKNDQQKLFEKSGKNTHKINIIMVKGLLNQMDCNHVVSREDLNLVYEYLF